MKNRNLIIMMAIGLFFAIILLSVLSLWGFKFTIEALYLATVIGMVCSVIYGVVNYARIRNMEHKYGNINKLLNEEERVVLDGIARCTSNKKTEVGRLYLTTDKIVFLPKQEKLVVQPLIKCSLSDVKQISIKKTLGIFTNGLRISCLNENWDFTIDFPDDWKCLIYKQISIVSA